MSASHAQADVWLGNLTGSHVQLHAGNPGAGGTANIAQNASAANAPRKAVTLGAAENHPSNSERRRVSTSAPEWSGTELGGGQTITHFSLWSAATGGTVRKIAALQSPKVTGSDGAIFEAGSIEVAIGVFAKP